MQDRKIIIASEFFNELDLLEMKLEILDPVVDYFVISESTKTHSGKDKPLYYEESKERYKKFHHKIIHQIIDDSPANMEELINISPKNDYHDIAISHVAHADWFDKKVESYLRDDYEKECLLIPLIDKDPKDIILLGDLDEIPNPYIILSLKDGVKEGWFDHYLVYHLEQGMFYYYLNCQKVNEPWRGTLATTIENFAKEGFGRMRTHKKGATIKNGGWHFTYMGGAEKIKTKIESWGEQSLNTDAVKNHIGYNFENFLKEGKDVFFRPAEFLIRDIHDGTFPEYLVKNEEKYSKYIYKGASK